MTTREAFEKMIHIRGIHHKLGTHTGHVTRIRYDLKQGRVSLDRMEDLLEKAGWKKVVVEDWEKEE